MEDKTNYNKIQELLSKDHLSEEEKEWLVNHNDELVLIAQEDVIISNMIRTESNDETLKRLDTIRAIIDKRQVIEMERDRPVIRTMQWMKYAAAIIIVVMSTVFLLKEHIVNKELAVIYDKAPGYDKAVLILADGSEISLDTLSHGKLTSQGSSDILVLETGKIEYVGNGKNAKELGFNTIKTPKGGQFKLQLPDGSKVWINAASSITYPTVFTNNERRVKVSGEVYFEVAKDANKPFIVDANKAAVEVLGTSFNINAYENEVYFQTTLIDGKVKVVANQPTASSSVQKFVILKPGQQAKAKSLGHTESMEVLDNVDLEQIVAWKDGIFNFEELDLVSLMNQLERWYDIEVQYEGKVKNITFRGSMYRNVNLSDILKMIEKMGVNYKQEGNRIIIK